MHVDTGQNFDEVIDFRDRTVEQVRPAADRRPACRTTSTPGGSSRSTARRAPATGCRRSPCCAGSPRTSSARSSAAPAATRRRPAPRSGSSASATSSASGIPRNQRPELWNLYNGRHRKGENIRVFPLSNWTELDIWSYIRDEQHRAAVALLRAQAQVVERDGMLLAVNRFIAARRRARTASRRRCGSARSATPPAPAASSRSPPTPDAVVAEVAAARLTERGATRADDRISEAGMEDRKKEGYF